MKIIIIFFTSFIACSCLFAQSKKTEADNVIKMNKEIHDFGKIKQSVPVVYTFEIKNVSDKDVVIANVSASSGSVVPDKPQQPIAPGKVAPLKVQFNAPIVGPVNKVIYITVAGLNGSKEIQIVGEVLSPESYEEWLKNQPKKPNKN